jgi:hypothetical protein
MSNSNDVIKDAARYLQHEIDIKFDIPLQSSHAHALIAGYLGFNSKKALLAYNYEEPITDPFFLHSGDFQTSEENLNSTLDRIKSSPIKNIRVDLLINSIDTALTPNCECCDRKRLRSFTVFNEDDEPEAQVCRSCLKENEEDYSTCIYCGDHIIYRSEIINRHGECPNHDGESYMDEDETEDWLSYIENITKDG